MTNQKTPCHPATAAICGQTIESSVMERGTQQHQSPSAKPRVFSGNHRVISVGAATPTRPMPVPSTKRPIISVATLSPPSTSTRPPTITPRAESAMVLRRPILRQMNAAGNASRMPMSDTSVISQPKPAASSPKQPSGLMPGMKMK